MILTGNHLLEYAVCSVSRFQLHPLGFYFLKRQAEVNLVQRVHVWLSPMDNLLTNDMHMHSYDLDSSVVLGKLRNELLEFTEDAHGSILEFLVSYNGSESALNSTGRRGTIRTIDAFNTNTGNRYCLRAGRIHRALAVTIPSVTILNTREQGHPIYSYGPSQVTRPFYRRDVGRLETKGIEAALIASIRLIGDK